MIQSSEFKFTAPVVGGFVAPCTLHEPKLYARFLKMLERKGKARMVLDSTVTCDGVVCGTHRGEYVAIRD